ncbi:MAG: Fic family protein [Bacteroidia bacterium]|nr:Fic family protein [Bacteroidia bacterium]
MPRYIHQLKQWPEFEWKSEIVVPLISALRHKQGRLGGAMDFIGFASAEEPLLQTLTLDVLKSSEIEGEMLHPEQVRSSIARKLGLDIAGLVPSDLFVDGVVEMMLDATQNFNKPLTKTRLYSWHAALFPKGRSGMQKITVGKWRDSKGGPMQVVSGVMGKERVHFEAPESERLDDEMKVFLKWFNSKNVSDPVLKAAIAHLWFITIHPFDDGNGRMARAIADMQLAKSDGDSQRFYSMSAQIRIERNAYYHILEKTQHGKLEITQWLQWFMKCLDSALNATDITLRRILSKGKFWDKHQKSNLNQRQRLMINKLFDGFDGNLNTTKWGEIAKCSHDTALRDINDLLEKKILSKGEGGGRSTSYILNY